MGKIVSLVLLLCIIRGVRFVQAISAKEFPGPYCERRLDQPCCSNRQDNCTVPIAGTLCYCDEFCDKIPNHDCCPDYHSFCGQRRTPEFCHHKGVRVRTHTSFSDNCNKCYCDREQRVTCEQKVCLVTEDLINTVNSVSSALGWTAGNYSGFWGRTLDEGLARRLGTFEPVNTKFMTKQRKKPIALPPHFDAVKKWPKFVKDVKDQGWCGCSWAMSTISVASDRFSIHSKGVENVDLSPQNLLSCNTEGQYGCSGGYVDKAWTYLRLSGVVEDRCYPFIKRPDQCRFEKKKPVDLATAKCLPLMSMRTDFYKTGPAYPLKSERDVMTEIYLNGPVQATIQVFQDFFVYTGGVYQRSAVGNQTASGWHSVKVVGWGEDRRSSNIVKYWIAANSWGKWWGESGYFRILRGQNHCGIEEYVFTVSVNIQK